MACYLQLYVHCVWATWDRLPLIEPSWEQQLYAALLAKAEALNCTPIAVGGVADHVHFLAGFPSTLTISRLLNELKGASSHLVTHRLQPGSWFKWQGSYSAFTVSYQAVEQVKAYVQCQKYHHNQALLWPEFEL